MEEKKINHFIAGGIVGGISILFSVILIVTDQMQNQKVGWIGTIVMIIALAYFVIAYGNSKSNTLGFGELFSFGFKSSAFATIIILAFQVIYNLLFPELQDKIIDFTRQKMMEDPRVTEEAVEKGLAFVKKGYWPFLIGGTIFSTLFSGLIASLLGAAITKKKPQTPFQ
jgi:hypothetical protein